MKKSEELKQLAATEENDFKAMNLQTKALREHKWENFRDIWWPKLLEAHRVLSIVLESETHKAIIEIDEAGNKWDFFPKANKLLIRKGNKWKKPGLQFLIDNVINRKPNENKNSSSGIKS